MKTRPLSLFGLRGNYPNVAKAGGLQSQGVRDEIVVGYLDSLATQDLMSSGFPRCFQGNQYGKIDPIL